MIITISDTDAQKLITKIQPGLGEKHHPTKLQPFIIYIIFPINTNIEPNANFHTGIFSDLDEMQKAKPN